MFAVLQGEKKPKYLTLRKQLFCKHSKVMGNPFNNFFKPLFFFFFFYYEGPALSVSMSQLDVDSALSKLIMERCCKDLVGP